MWHILGRRERNHLNDLSADGIMLLKQICQKKDRKAWTGFILLRRVASGRPL